MGMIDSDLIDSDIGPDTVTLVFRDPAPGYDAHGRPNVNERTVVKTGCAFQFDRRPTEDMDETGTVASIRRPTCRLPVDSDTTTLDTTAAIRFQGRTYEMQGPAIIRETMDGVLDHVYCDVGDIYDTGRGEKVTITPNAGRDDDGNVVSGGPPFDVVAIDVTAGTTTAAFGPSGEVSQADFTIVLPIDTPIHNDDWVTVRGLTGRARIQMNLPQYAGRERLVVLVSTKTGGKS